MTDATIVAVPGLREVAELAGLVYARGDHATTRRLRDLVDRLRAGAPADADDTALLRAMRRRFARELADLDRAASPAGRQGLEAPA